MSAPQPPDDHAPPPGPAVPEPPTSATPGTPADPSPGRSTPGSAADTHTFDFHGEKLDFDPYRFGAPEPAAPTWGAPPPSSTEPGRPPEPGDRWAPGAGDPGPAVRPGDYWQGGGSTPRADQPPQDAVFPPPGYRPPPTGGAPTAPGGPAVPGPAVPGPGDPGPAQYGGYPSPPYTGYGPPGGYPGRPGPSEADRWRAGNKIAMWGFGLALLGCALFFTSFIAVLIGGTALGLSIAGLVKARRGAPHKGFAIFGIVFSIVAVVAGVSVVVWALSQYDLTCIANLHGDTSRINECVR